ncbi:MAG: HAD family hydrolase [Sporichthyaceae bacterium]|nr:HAD family hydrolase [Sporichthyaceae bacterium]
MSSFSLVATDLDGTLLHSDDSLSPRTRLALKAVAAAGAHHVIVTGRPVATARIVFDELGYEGLAVCAQGGQIYHAGRHALVSWVELDRELIKDVLARVTGELGELQVATARTALEGAILTPQGFPWPWAPTAMEIAADGELWSEPVLKAFIHHPKLTPDQLAAAAREIAGSVVDFVNGGGMVEVLPAGLNKATGLAEVAELVGATPEQVVAFGDMPADVPMLVWAGHGVAMANAHPELLAVAGEIAPSNNEDGVATVLERLFEAEL